MAKLILGLPFQESISNNISGRSWVRFFRHSENSGYMLFFVILITAIKDISFGNINFLVQVNDDSFVVITVFIQCRKL